MSKSCSTPKSTLPTIVKKETIKEIDLPDPFVFPRNYRPDVELDLQSGKMSREAKRSFLSSVASAMLSFKKFPNGEEYTRVACDIIKKYPFLKPPSGLATVSLSFVPLTCPDTMHSLFQNSIKQSLINRFKEFRHVPKEMQEKQCCQM